MSKIPADTLPAMTQLLEALPDPKVLVGPDYRIAAVNEAYRRQFGVDDEGVRGRFCYEVSHHYSTPCDQAGESCPLRDCLFSGEPRRVLHVHHTSAGPEHVEVEIAPVTGEEGGAFFLETMRILRHARFDTKERELVGFARPFLRMLELARRVSAKDASVLLLGESGTGKELVAHAIHDMSPYADAPFVAVDCSSLTETLFESELFGHERGAFTGALSRKIGLVEAAEGGTLFLDEVGDIPLPLQVKLLRLLETGTYRRVGGVEPLSANFRVISATHRDLEAMVKAGTFRQDLYYRINVFPIPLPALRQRLRDLPQLVEQLLARLEPRRSAALSREALSLLATHDFPGNVRELRNLLERALVLADGNVLKPQHFPDLLDGTQTPGSLEMEFSGIVPLEQLEKSYLEWAVATFPGDRQSLATKLGVSERTLYRKLRESSKQPDYDEPDPQQQ
jgi:transcriptional regulator with PAS, ATPase and Fis domain